MEKKLAIIIPAYKARFLRETLDSILKRIVQNLLYMWVMMRVRRI